MGSKGEEAFQCFVSNLRLIGKKKKFFLLSSISFTIIHQLPASL